LILIGIGTWIAYSVYQVTRQQGDLQIEQARPIVITGISECKYDLKYVKIAFIIKNKGPSTITLREFNLGMPIGENLVFGMVKDEFVDAIVYPDTERRVVYRVKRPSKAKTPDGGDITYDPYQTINEFGKIPTQIHFSTYQDPEQIYTELIAFPMTTVRWHDCRLVGVGD